MIWSASFFLERGGLRSEKSDLGGFNRSEISSPITHSHEYGAADDVADRDGEQVSP